LKSAFVWDGLLT